MDAVVYENAWWLLLLGSLVTLLLQSLLKRWYTRRSAPAVPEATRPHRDPRVPVIVERHLLRQELEEILGESDAKRLIRSEAIKQKRFEGDPRVLVACINIAMSRQAVARRAAAALGHGTGAAPDAVTQRRAA